MPTSTLWRRRSSVSLRRGVSPTRPSGNSIERLSPVPFEPSSTFTSTTWRSDSRLGEDNYISGLGLSGTSLSNYRHEVAQLNHVYLDTNGGAHIGSKGRSVAQHVQKHIKGTSLTEARSDSRNTRTSRGKSHTRSGSTIDDLANAAIATSPRFAAASPNHVFSSSPSAHNAVRPATSYVNIHNQEDAAYERPAKRIKSDRLHAADWPSRNDRPRTSHASDYQSPRTEEAELLLSLRYAWGVQASPSVPLATLQTDNMKENIQPPSDKPSVPEQSFEDKQEKEAQEVLAPTPSDITTEAVESARLEDRTPDSHVQQDEVAGEAAEPSENQQIEKPPMDTAVEETKEETETTKADQLEVKEPLLELTTVKPEVAPKVESPAKKLKKIRPVVQAEVCASCLKLQRDGGDEDNTTQWIGCEHCKNWFHMACVGLKDKTEARSVDKFSCKDCEVEHGKTTFVRKSSRARTAIDYAGLNQGVVKPSGESTMHHYIQPIKDGRIKYLSDDFARVRPELMTAEFWENMDGMKRPFVVPACWNPRFGAPKDTDEAQVDSLSGEPVSASSYQYYNELGEEIRDVPGSADEPSTKSSINSSHTEVVDCDQDYLDMVMPRDLTVRKVAELFGPEQPVPVIDVKSQETKGQFTLADWADYYELEGDKPIRNVISLEVSSSRLGRLIRRPRVVRDIDLEDHVWDNDTRSMSNKRPVQFYCLMSVADSYTDFHIDFGGSSVYYHILKGVKTFFFIPPEDKYLKKYEEWCNSDTQNDTWLGDLCNGNVTRVDLHEGDTAFIPAGWIHSVWTPEDSLVVGGNFLTRLDYELQLKVANIEKTTRVPQKFRYPFFQKVMWYSLLKYLEEDPVPEEVLCDFHEDEEYRFLRANPIWSEIGDLATDAEPDEPLYNTRIYPKSELKGLPALRDYLYRTARIHADLPVPDINKKQIDAVKASIPKGHGDPMQLIKTFAVWCAWKIGNETVPEWVHTDMNGLLPELKEREKSRKAEVFRVPPERVSARKAQQVQSMSTEDNSPTNRSGPASENEEVAKKRNGSKSTGLRVACDACRKRRIKCRHKEGDASPSGASPAAIRPRTYSNVSVDIPKLASASPILTGYEQAPVANGSSATLDFSSTDLAQAALATLQSQSSDPSPSVANGTPVGSAKKGRSKACEECRKSKRRCVHDEYGRVDPAKAAEPSKPRGSASSKRPARISDEGSGKRVKVESEIESALTAISQSTITDAMIDPLLMADTSHATAFHSQSMSYYPALDEMDLDNIDPSLSNGQSHDDFIDNLVGEQIGADVHVTNGASGDVYDPEQIASSANTENIEQPMPIQVDGLRQSPVHDVSFSPITVDGNVPESIEKADALAADLHASTSNSRHSSRPPKLVERHVPEGRKSPSKPLPKSIKSERRASSEASGHTTESVRKSRRSSSNTSGTTHRAGATLMKPQSLTRPISRESTIDSDADADEKLARELQAAENGLRRRASVRA